LARGLNRASSRLLTGSIHHEQQKKSSEEKAAEHPHRIPPGDYLLNPARQAAAIAQQLMEDA
jgi:hypothetical protein